MQKNKTLFHLNECDWFLVLFLLCNRGNFFSGTPTLIMLVLIISISMYYFFYVNFHYKSSYIKALNCLIALLTFYGLFYMADGSVHRHMGATFNSYTYIINNYASLLPIYPMYAYCRRGLIDEKRIKIWILPFILVVIATFFVKQSEVLLDKGVEEATNNVGFAFVSLMPLLFLLKEKPLYQYVALAIIMAFVIISVKRGAILIAVVVAIFMLYSEFKRTKSRNKIVMLALTLVFMLFMYKFVLNVYENSSYFQFRFEQTMEGNSSQREDLYGKAIDFWLYKADVTHFLFGAGANQTYDILGNRAHNDWLELAINQGLLGVLVYFYYWLVILSYRIKYGRISLYISQVLQSFILIYLLKSFFSMSYDGMEIYSCLTIAWVISKIDLYKRKMRQGVVTSDYKPNIL